MRTGRCLLILLLGLFMSRVLPASQPAEVLDAARLQLALERLRVLGSALYVAAHPDDENTALLAWLGHERGIRTAYLSLTRGDGGQNLIGVEQGAELGLVRTQELLAARRLDGASQYFSRALDFGYSKSTEESLAWWGPEEVLADLVWVIRKQRPDIMLTRFSPTVGGHGHHTASATLALEAFEAAGNPEAFPEQLEWVEPFRPRRLFWNVWRPELEDRGAGAPQLVAIDVGGYNPLLGLSYTELAALSRSQHKSQGFGAAGSRGPRPEVLQLLAGEPLSEGSQDPFDGIDLGWSRVAGSKRLDKLLKEAQGAFEPRRPQAMLPQLMEAWSEIQRLEPDPWLDVKRAELAAVIRSAAGLWTEAVAGRRQATPGQTLEVTTRVINRSDYPFELVSLELPFGKPQQPAAGRLSPNRVLETTWELSLPRSLPASQPYWLSEPRERGRYRLPDHALAGLPESPPAVSARFVLRSLEQQAPDIVYEEPVLYRWTDPVQGERYRALAIVPAVTLELLNDVYLFSDTRAKAVAVTLQAHAPGQKGRARLELPAGWRVEPDAQSFELEAAGDEQVFVFLVTPPAQAGSGQLQALAETSEGTYGRELVSIQYDHIPTQTHLPPARARVVRVDLGAPRPRIGYVMGAGDKLPEALTQAGYRVKGLDDDALDAGLFDDYDTIVLGVRAFNTRQRLIPARQRLLEWVHEGGTLVVQYNVSHNLLSDAIGPYPMTLSRDRVTLEDAPVSFNLPEHPLLHHPNRILAADFDGWVQERGLYFASEWDPRYEAPLASQDPGEPPTSGCLLYTPYGQGVFVYTGLSFFRQLPAGVPGAYRLFANLLAAGHAGK